MEATLKKAAITTVIVLVSIYVLRKIPVTNSLVATALNG